MSSLQEVGAVIALALIGVLVFRAARAKKKRTPADWYIAELRKAKAQRTSLNVGETAWLTRSR